MHWPNDAFLSWETVFNFINNSIDGGKIAVSDSKSFIAKSFISNVFLRAPPSISFALAMIILVLSFVKLPFQSGYCLSFMNLFAISLKHTLLLFPGLFVKKMSSLYCSCNCCLNHMTPVIEPVSDRAKFFMYLSDGEQLCLIIQSVTQLKKRILFISLHWPTWCNWTSFRAWQCRAPN